MPNPTPAQPSEPMVTVKKADGTFAKVPLSQVRNMKTQKTDRQSAVSNQPSAISKDVRTPQQPKSDSQSLKSEVHSPKSDRPPQTLAEGIERMLAERRRIGQDEVIQNIRNTKTTKIRNEGEEKGNEETRLPARQVKKLGNSEITKLRNEEIKRTPNSELRTPQPNWAADDHKSLLDDEFHKEDLPMVIEARRQALAKVRPTAFQPKADPPMAEKHENTENMKTQKTRNDEIAKLGNKEMRATPNSELRTPIKPMMHDVRPGTPTTEKRGLGPVDELRSFSLADLRHLDVTPQAAGSKLTQKFETLKDESYLLYMEGVKAWRESPLYRQYQDGLRRALSARQTVSQALGNGQDREAMKLAEWGAVVKVNQSLV